jgi:hypothetical protein
MDVDATLYVSDARTITIERVPNRGLVRIKIRGAGEGSYCDEMSITVWGDPTERTMPEVIDTTCDQPDAPVVTEEEADI